MTVNSSQLTRNDYNQFVFENDTLRLIYDIAGDGGEVTLRVFNKTSQPITINWQRSAFIRNQQTVNFLNKDVIIHGHTVLIAAITSNFIGSFALPDSAGFIPPGSEISNDLPTLAKTGPLQVYCPRQPAAENSWPIPMASTRSNSGRFTMTKPALRSGSAAILRFPSGMTTKNSR